ncbi:MAG: ComF family protein [Acidobacteriota bacterium]|nr:ComF family protein [Acidobacteriota bacterium]
MTPLTGPACLRCGDTLDPRSLNSSKTQCRACRLAPPAFVRAASFGPFDGRIRDAIHALKYGGLQPAARRLGEKLAIAIASLANHAPAEMLVVPVPLHRSRHRTRGFNQTRLLAEQALKSLAKSHPDWKLELSPHALLRIKSTNSQAGLSRRERRLNLRKAFAVADATAIAGRDILLIDDILTTGATVRAASRVLVEAGANSVWVATLARAGRLIHHASSAGASFDASITAHSRPQPFTAAHGMQATQHQPSF